MIFSTRRISIAGVPPAISEAAVFLALKPQWHREQSRSDEGVSRKNRERIVSAYASAFADKAARCVLITITLRLYYRTGSD